MLKSNLFVQFEPLTHNYICGNKVLVGVTTLLKKHNLSPNYAGISEDVLDKAAQDGTAVHELLENYDNGKCALTNDIISGYTKVMQDYPKVLASEYLVSDNNLVASKIDKVLADYSLIDIKTTSKIHTKSVEWQLSIYAYLFELQTGFKVPALYCLHYDKKKGTFKMHEVRRLQNKMIEELFAAEAEGRIYCPVRENILLKIFSDDELAHFVENETKIAELQETVKTLTSLQEMMKERLIEYMQSNAIKSMESDILKITYVEPTERRSIDSTRLKKEMPDIAAQYEKVSKVKSSIRISLK